MLASREVERHCALDANGMGVLQRAIAKLDVSARSYHRTL